jgi:hypothetical protein
MDSSTTNPGSQADEAQVEEAIRLERVDACNDRGFVTAFRVEIKKRIDELIKPQTSFTEMRKTALLIARRVEGYIIFESELTSDLIASEAADIAREASSVAEAFRLTAAISSREDFEVAFTDAFLEYTDLDQNIEGFIGTAYEVCKGN